MSKVIVATMVKNEADRFFRSALEAWRTFADGLVLFDDNSTDDTVALAREIFGPDLHVLYNEMDSSAAWGNEWAPRQALFETALNVAGVGNIVFFLDADMVPARNPRTLFDNTDDSYYAFPLYDLWSADPLAYREDHFWSAHNNWRIWALRVPERPLSGWFFEERGIHCGHLPINLPLGPILFLPRDYSLLHYGYAGPDLRTEKYERYLSVSSELSPQEIAHAVSIIDPTPRILPLAFRPDLQLSRACVSL